MRTCFVASKILTLLVIFCTICGLSCKRKAPQPTDVNKPIKVSEKPTPPKVDVVEPNIPAKADPNSVAVTVNGNSITEGEVNKIVDMQLAGIAERGPKRSPEFMEQYRKILRQDTLDALIVSRLLDEKVKEAKITVTDEEIDNRLKEIATAQQLSVEDFKKKVQDYGQNFDDLKGQLQKGLAYQKLMETQSGGKVTVAEEDAKKFYDENQKRFEMPEQVRASHLLIRPDPNADPNQAKAAAKAKIQDLLTKVKAGGDFAQLAKENSACPSSANGGDLGFKPRGQWELAFEKAAFELQPGQISDIVETLYGYHIIKVTERKAASLMPFEQIKDRIINQLTQRKRSELASQYVQQLRTNAKIVYPPGKEPKPAEPPIAPGPSLQK
jgi:peptidyl-prolyl cis-trans isomerase C